MSLLLLFNLPSTTTLPQGTGGGAGRPVGINHQIPRRAATLKEKPLQHLDFILKNVVAEVFGELTTEVVSQEVKAQVEEIVKDYQMHGIISEHVVTPIDWEAFTHDIARIQQLMDLWQQEVENERIEDFNRMYLLLLN